MRFSLTHKLSCYLMVLAAAASLLTSPELSTSTTVLALVGILGSWFAEPPRYPLVRLTLAWNVLTLAVFALLVAQVVVSGDSLITAGVHFLLLVLVNKLFNRRNAKDYQQIYVVSFLMLVAATTLNTSLTYAACFVAYTVFATWSLILFHLRREMEENYLLKHTDESSQSEKVQVERILNSRRIVGGAFLASTSLLSLGVLLGAGLIFIFFPRIGFGLFASQKRRPVTMAGFSERVELGQHGTIRDNPQVVLRVVLGPKGKALRHPPEKRLLWRGAVYDHYSRGSWSHGPTFSGRPRPVYAQDGLFRMNYAPGLDEGASPTHLRRTLLRQQIYLEPLDSQVIFAADRPVALEVPRNKLNRKLIFVPLRGPLGELRAGRRPRSGILYVAYSQLYSPDPALLRRASPVATPRYAPFLQLPAEVPLRVRALARRITAGKRTVYDKVLAVQSYLQREQRYTLKLEHRSGREPVDEFLFETHRGHCEYFASAMALLLRAAGIHSRHVNGFAGGQWNGYGNYLAVRQGDAHAWTEVLFSNVGWVAFDPTPSQGSEPAGPTGVWQSVQLLVDALRLRWFNYVVEYDIAKQMTLFSRLKRLVRGKVTRSPRASLFRRYQRPLSIGAGLLLAVALLVWWRRRRRHHRDPLRAAERRMAAHPATRVYRRALDLLAKANVPRPPHVTPGELAATLSASAHPCAPLLTALTQCYYDCRFAPTPAPTRLAELESLEQKLREGLRAAAQQP